MQRTKIKSIGSRSQFQFHPTPVKPFSIIAPPPFEEIQLYNKENIQSLIWPNTEEGNYAKNFLLPMIQNGVATYISNIDTDLQLLKIQDTLIPITINDAEYSNSYVCSPYSYFISYAQTSLDVIQFKPLQKIVKSALWGMSKFFKGLKMNKVITVNNWLCPTNLFPTLDSKQLSPLIEFLKKRFPCHAIIFRSIDQQNTPEQFICLKESAFDLISFRQIFFTDTKNSKLFEARIFKSDQKLLESCGYEIIDSNQLSHADIERILELYENIYIKKYSKLNPQLTLQYIKLALDQQTLIIKALKKDGIIDGVVGYFCRNGYMTCPLFGYDKSRPSNTALYRLLSTLLMLEAKEKGLIFHQSAGASTYKKIRKAKDCIEYLAVYNQHLSLPRKFPWKLLKGIFNSLGVHFMKKY